jgi:hypothetical protein
MNPYLQKLHSLERQPSTENPETRHLQQVSKPTEPGFDSFDSPQGLRVFENSCSATGEEGAQGMQWGMAENQKTATPDNCQNRQNLPY